MAKSTEIALGSSTIVLIVILVLIYFAGKYFNWW